MPGQREQALPRVLAIRARVEDHLAAGHGARQAKQRPPACLRHRQALGVGLGDGLGGRERVGHAAQGRSSGSP